MWACVCVHIATWRLCQPGMPGTQDQRKESMRGAAEYQPPDKFPASIKHDSPKEDTGHIFIYIQCTYVT